MSIKRQQPFFLSFKNKNVIIFKNFIMKIVELFKQGALYLPRFIKGRISETEKTIKDLKNGEGAVIKESDEAHAVYKDENGRIIKLSAVCTHMKCIVAWDDKNKNWVCPCHKSKYDPYGKIINGPAKRDLESAE